VNWVSLAIAGLKFVSWFGRWAERLSGRLQGRAEQRLATLEGRERQASDANRIDEDVRRMSDDDLDRELRSGPRK